MVIFSFATFCIVLLACLVFVEWGVATVWLLALPALALTGLACVWPVQRWFLRERPRSGDRQRRHGSMLRHLAEEAGQPALLVENGRIGSVNRAMLRSLGLEGRSDELIGMPLDNIVHPKHHQRLAALLADETAVGDHGAVTLLRADGTPWISRVSLFRGLDSHLSLLHFSASDRGDGRDEAELWSRRWRSASRELLFALDSEMALCYLQGRREEGAGDLRDDLGKPFLSLFVTEDRAALNRGLRQLRAGEADRVAMEARLLQPGGRQCWVEVRAWPLQLALEDGVGVAGLLLDIAQRKRSEELLRAQRRSLHTMLDNLPGMLYRGQNDPRWTIEYVSEGCFELTGYTPLDLVDNHTVSLVELIHPEDRDYVWSFVQMRLTLKERYELNYRIVDREGRARWVWEQGRGIYSSKGEFLGLEGYITEVSSRGAQEQARRRLFFDNAAGIVSLGFFLERLDHLFVHAPLAGYPFLLAAVTPLDLDEASASHGAAMVERLQMEIGRRLRVVISDCNVVARRGERGFVLLFADFRAETLQWAVDLLGEAVPDETRLALPEWLRRALAALLARPFQIEGRSLKVACGIAASGDGEAYPDARAMLEALQRWAVAQS